MRCKEVQDRIVDGQWEAPVRTHLAACTACRAFAADWEQLEAALRGLGMETGPEPSWGFAARVLRRLEESSREELEFVERAGRRAVYAAGLVAFVIWLAVALPSPGPLRGPAPAELSPTHAQAARPAASVFASDVDEGEDLSPLPVALNGVEPK